jgi:ribosomal protein L11 methyltransferase
LLALRVIVEPAGEDDATAALWEAGTLGVEVKPASERRVELVAYFETPPGLAELRRTLPDAEIDPVPVPEVDWLARFREGFGSFRVGRFEVVPAWEASGTALERLVVDPGRAFGTGTHETTRLCLQALEDLASRRSLGRTLDLGSGTALLAIAAGRLGATPVVASDIDPEAVAASRHHAALNAAKIHVVRADGARGLRPAAFDLVLANLMALLLVDRAQEIQALLSPNAALVLSGLLLDDVAPVRRAFAASGVPREHRLGDWAALVFDGGDAQRTPPRSGAA